MAVQEASGVMVATMLGATWDDAKRLPPGGRSQDAMQGMARYGLGQRIGACN